MNIIDAFKVKNAKLANMEDLKENQKLNNFYLDKWEQDICIS